MGTMENSTVLHKAAPHLVCWWADYGHVEDSGTLVGGRVEDDRFCVRVRACVCVQATEIERLVACTFQHH